VLVKSERSDPEPDTYASDASYPVQLQFQGKLPAGTGLQRRL